MEKQWNNEHITKSKYTRLLHKLWFTAAMILTLNACDWVKKTDKENNKIETIKQEHINTSKEWLLAVEKAKEEVRKNWIPEFQKAGYVKHRSERAFNNITPQGYWDLKYNLKRYHRFKNNLGRDKEDLWRYLKWDTLPSGEVSKKNIYYQIPKRDDAFLLYLGMPQKNNSFWISDYQPIKSKDKNKIYFKLNYLSDNMKEYLIKSYFEKKARVISDKEDSTKIIMNERWSSFEFKLDSLKAKGISRDNPENAEWLLDNPLWDFKVSEWKDEKWNFLSIYDIRDLSPFKTGKGSSINTKLASTLLLAALKKEGYNANEDTEVSELFWAGKPFEIYDRIYYNPITKKIIK